MKATNKKSYAIGKTSNVDFKLLSVFISVVESGGFTQAQEELNVALSSISTYINELESRLGLKVCNRGRRGFSLTEHGSKVYQEAKTLFSHIDRFSAEIANLRGELAGELRIGILDNSTMSPSTRVPEVIHHFSEKHPDVYITIKVLSSEEIESELMNGGLHLGIGLFSEIKQGLRLLVKFPVIVDLYCGNKNPLFDVDIDSMEDLHITGYAKGCYSPDSKSELFRKLPLPTASSYLSEGLAFLIMSGRYCGYLPRRYSSNWVKNGEMKALNEEVFSHQIELSLITRRGTELGGTIKAFLNSFSAFPRGD